MNRISCIIFTIFIYHCCHVSSGDIPGIAQIKDKIKEIFVPSKSMPNCRMKRMERVDVRTISSSSWLWLLIFTNFFLLENG